jgi:CDP-diacylglycerol--glycerol-3-phosphate 3-phosphatidyltransferase
MNVPNTLTTIRLALAPLLLVVCTLQSAWAHVAAVVLLISAMVTDAIDGHYARTRGQVTELGGLLDPFADSLIFLTLFLWFTLAGWMPLWMFACVFYREVLMHSFLRPLLLRKGLVLSASKWGKLKTIVQSIVGPFVLAFSAYLRFLQDSRYAEHYERHSAFLHWAAWGGLLLVVVLSVGSMLNYLWQTRAKITGSQEEPATSEGPEHDNERVENNSG